MNQFARDLRIRLTDAERLLWRHLRNRRLEGDKFRRQQAIGPYIVNFICFEKKLIVELDGGQHAENIAYDHRRTVFLDAEGFRVMRFWNNEVLGQTEAVLSAIQSALEKPPLTLALSPTSVVERGTIEPPLPLAGEGGGEGRLRERAG